MPSARTAVVHASTEDGRVLRWRMRFSIRPRYTQSPASPPSPASRNRRNPAARRSRRWWEVTATAQLLQETCGPPYAGRAVSGGAGDPRRRERRSRHRGRRAAIESRSVRTPSILNGVRWWRAAPPPPQIAWSRRRGNLRRDHAISVLRGSRRTNVAPRPGSLRTAADPPCASASCRTMARPIPPETPTSSLIAPSSALELDLL